MPFAPAETSIPLAFQKRVCAVDVLVVRCVDEHGGLDRLAVGGELVALDLADGHAAIVNRCADSDGSQGSWR